MKLLVGLGNPGSEHARNRHNVGFMAADAIHAAHGFGPWRKRFRGETAEGLLGGEKCLLLKPSTYMNESGQAAGEAVRFFKLEPDEVIVFYDELDLAPGKVRVRSGGGAAGHNGVRSMASHVGADFVRVRIGIGHPGSKAKVQGYVLRDFPRAERDWLEPLLDAIAAAAPKLARGDGAGFMNEVALKTQPFKEEWTPPKGGKDTAGRPSQRELARRAAEKTEGREERREAEDEAGPFARLRGLFHTDKK